MESKYKVGQVVIIAEYLGGFKESEHRHLTEVMKEAYSDFALIVDVKPGEGITCSKKDDGFNYYLKIYRDRSYVKECESEYWTSDLFEESATPIFKINDIVRFNSDQYDKTSIYKVDSYYKDTDNNNLEVGYYLVDVNNSNNKHCVNANEAKFLELISVEQVDVSSPSLEGKLCCVKSDADIIADYNAADVEFTKQQIIKLQQKVKEYENRLRKQEESITGSGRPGELGILNPGNKTRLRNPETILTTISLDRRKRVGFFED